MTRSLKDRLLVSYLTLILLALVLPGLFMSIGLRSHELSGLQAQLTNQALLARDTAGRALAHKGADGPPQAVADRLKADSGSRVTLIDASGRVVADSDRPASEMETHLGRFEVDEALAGKIGFDTRLSRTLGVEMLYAAVPVYENPDAEEMGGGTVAGVVRFSRPLRQADQALFSLWKTLSLTMIGSGLLGILISLRLSENFTESIREVTWVAARIGSGDYSRRVFPRENDEIGQLGSAVNRMAETIEATLGELKGQKERLEAILRNLRTGVAFVDAAGAVLLFNPAFTRLIGVSVPSGRSHWEAFQNYELSDLVETVRVTGQASNREVVIHRPGEHPGSNSTDHRLRVQILPFQGSGDLLLVVDDLTELRRLERIRAELVASVSHELRTPVTSIKGFAETLLEDGLEDKKQALEFLGIIDKEAGRLARLIEDLLQLSKLESGQLELRMAPLDIAVFLDEVLSKVRPRAEKAGIGLRLEAGPGIVVQADSDRLEQVILNLLDNSFKHTPSGGLVTVTAETALESERPEPVLTAHIVVRDTGSGIPREDLSRIFERFYRVDPARSRRTGGSGLGLAIAKHLVESHGGQISVDSQPGRGARFTVTLPVGGVSG